MSAVPGEDAAHAPRGRKPLFEGPWFLDGPWWVRKYRPMRAHYALDEVWWTPDTLGPPSIAAVFIGEAK